MNNQDRFREWYILQVNPRTGLPYAETSVNAYITPINNLVRAGLVCSNIFNVDAEEFMRQINIAKSLHPAEFAALEHHGNLKNGIKWWKRFLDELSTMAPSKRLSPLVISGTRSCCKENGPSNGVGKVLVSPIKNGCLTKDFIKDVMSIPSCSSKERMMKEYITQFANDRGIELEEDAKGNVYLTKGRSTNGYYPCLVNHMDTVQEWQNSLIDRHERLNVLERACNGHTELYTAGGGIGADDKLGCAIALALVDTLPVVKAAFFVEEELGMRGSKELNRNWFKDVGFCLSFDSPGRNRSSRLCSGRQLYSDTFFHEVLRPICTEHGITNFNSEPYTDVTQIRDQTPIMCYNVGNGGYDAHRHSEYLVIEDAQSAYKFGLDLMRKIGENQYWFED